MQSKNLYFEPLTDTHANDLFSILTTPSVLAFIDPNGNPPTIEELKAEYAARSRGPVVLTTSTERWFNMAIRLKIPALSDNRLKNIFVVYSLNDADRTYSRVQTF